MADNPNPPVLPLLPLRDLIVFPHMMMPLFVGRDKSTAALEKAMNDQIDIVLVAQKDAKTNTPTPDDLYEVGTLGTIIQLLRLPDGTVKILIEGKKRVQITKHVENDSYFSVEYKLIEESTESELEAEALVRSVKATFESYVKLNKRIPPEVLMRVTSVEEPGELADTISSQLNLKLEKKQSLLEIFDYRDRLEELLNIMTGEIEILEVEKKIRNRVKQQMEKSQKEYYLNEQIQAIQKELGDKDDLQSEMNELTEKANKLEMSKEAREKFDKEIKKLKMMSPMSAESAVVRNYLDWMVSLPWGILKQETLDIQKAKDILDEDHWGLEKVKERILEYLAVQTLSSEQSSPILCLVGPPGVGKTSLARSVARALNRSFCRISLGGVRDEAEIRGHRRTYVGAMPGKIIQSMKKVDTNNPLILLDEIDKMSMDFRGDPSAALLEVLDPEQNATFQDHYLEVEYDLSKVLFFTTANSLHTIPRPLLDRMEVISLTSYIEAEKLNIAKKYLIPKQIKKHGLADYNVSFQDTGILSLIRHYTKEAGVRNLEREAGKVCRKLAKEIVEEEFAKKKKTAPKKRSVTGKKVVELLGPHKFKFGKIEKADQIGLTNGLAWTQVGGDLLVIEVSVVPGRGKFTITGQLGDVMKESCTAALSYVRSRGPLFGYDKEFFAGHDIHIHVPEGAIPKDGPSAGISITTSIVSAMMKIPVKQTVAMTGEVTLRGRVLAIGGLREKLLAAHRAGIKTAIIPKENENDLRDVPKEVLEDMKIISVDHVDQVLVNAMDVKSAKDIFKVRSEGRLGVKAQYTGHSLNAPH